ncbi:DUF1028 domain-containing protein [Paraburkholderia silvatlantica]|uniref:DUF1028 domain-containing protein n=2 Tax=cellular organisms TaxID=131567 RepID=W2TP45_NECAM|nr:DUF1028 domain-containing protein [Paraburkholderia silvatlantica]XP_013305780.1 hypothetical protein NECAME_17436 [Necator americanus]ETN83553.1 hypothetical protein NECAME_17436 [Necator americanus]MBB2928070.1 putative Ntn-hydrolase superfamily protein [Paraburkholderia silvatlantica]PVY31036.1 putative Ntn-hydrolase superfamily protein [Paraburkholderia silvatlantica]PXW37172.1 putative Ntn-hydrolase superfamily protein [Paraburkholderia silvatlantica]
MTFSIVARCPRSEALGVAVSTAVPAVGAVCVYLRAGVGAVSTQAWVNPYLALNALDLLDQGTNAENALAQVLEDDPAAALRQVGIVGADGQSAAWTGSQCTCWAGQLNGPSWSIQGNMLTGSATLEAMREAFETSGEHSLAERLMRALEAGQAAGGDKRGRQSAALKVVHREAYALLDLRVDEHHDPIAELRRVFEVAQRQFVPFVEGMPTRDVPGRAPPADVVDLLLTPPQSRPGASEHPNAEMQVLGRWLGVEFAADRTAHNLATYRAILEEINKLRTLDLSALHPAVIFDPVRTYAEPSFRTGEA